MNIPSLEVFYKILEQAWSKKRFLLCHLIASPEDIERFKANFECSVEKGALLRRAQYYQSIQDHHFTVGVIETDSKTPDEDFFELTQWLEQQDNPLTLVLTGPVPESLKKHCVSYYLNMNSEVSSTSSSSPPLRDLVLCAFQNRRTEGQISARDFIAPFLDHIELNYHKYHLKHSTSLALYQIYQGLSGALEQRILSQYIKWALFDYLKSIKDYQKSLSR